MSVVSFLVAICVFFVGLVAYFLQSQWRVKEYQTWESHLLSHQVGISKETAREVVSNKIDLEALENKAWEIAIKYGCDFETACKIRDGHVSPSHTSPSKASSSFIIKPLQDLSNDLHIYEMVNEPATYINSSNTHTWAYKNDGNPRITHIVLAGHANGPVCKAISSLIYNTYLGMEHVGDSLLVPGACLLQEPVDVSNLSIALTIPSTSTPSPYKQTPPPLNEFLGSLQPFQQNIGLSHIQLVEDASYWRTEQTILRAIEKYQHTTKPILLKITNNNSISNAIFLPFLPLCSSNPIPLSFDLPLSIFETDSFTYLKEVHHQSLILEMTGDAVRRKEIYQAWLKRDEQSYQDYGNQYRAMSNEQKVAQTVAISGSRDFVNAVTRQDKKESYISPQMHYETNLPSLIRADKEWISKMDDIMGSLMNRDRTREHRLNELNLAVLIDSFLRGWPPVFLAGEKDNEGQKQYLQWCEEKRNVVWRTIHQQLLARGFRIEPLFEENTIFQIQLVSDRRLKVTPLHLAANQDLLVYLSPDCGVTYYVNKWARRKLLGSNIPNGTSNWEEACRFYEQGERWLDRVSEDKTTEANAIAQAINSFQLALKTHPVIVQKIWNGWWSHFSKNTSRDFESFKDLAKGFRAYFDADYRLSRDCLRRFIQAHPNVLPDPYVLLAIQELEQREGITPTLIEHHAKLTQYRTVLKKVRGIEDFIKSNEPLLAKIKEGAISAALEAQRLDEINRQAKEHADLVKKIDQLTKELNSLDNKLTESRQAVWHALKSGSNNHFEKARNLLPEYVEKILGEKKFSFSDVYAFRFHALREILRGDEYITIANALHMISSRLGRQDMTTIELRKEIGNCLQEAEYLEKDDMKELQVFLEKLENLLPEDRKVDAIVRELILRKDIDQIVTTYFQKGVTMYEQSAYLLPEFIEPIHRLTELYALHRLQYKKALQYMCNEKLPLRNCLLNAEFIILSHKKQNLAAIWFEDYRDVIGGSNKNGDSFDLIQVSNLSNEDRLHLAQQIENPQFRVTSIGLSSAEMILNTRIEPSPISRRWGKVLLGMEGWLTRLIAYLGILPIPSNKPISNKLLNTFEGKPRIDEIDLDINRIVSDFLQEVGDSKQDTSIVEFDLFSKSQAMPVN